MWDSLEISLNINSTLMQFSELQALNRNPKSMYEFDEKELRETPFQRSKYFEHVKAEAEQYPDKGEENHTYGGKIVEVWSIRGLFRFEKQRHQDFHQ